MAVNFNRDVHCLLGLPFDAVDMAGTLQRVRSAAAQRAPCFLSTANVNFLVGSRSDSAFRQSIINSDLTVADGMPLVWIARLLGVPIRDRVTGSNLFESLRAAPGRPLSVYFFGGPDGVAAAACAGLNAANSALVCVGHESGGFGSVEELSSEETLRRINAAKPDFLVVSLGAKKGQAWIERNRRRLDVPVISHLGAVLQFAAGTVRRAPVWVQKLGFEWLWRIKEQPALWRRYFSDGGVLAALVATRVFPHVWHRLWNRPDPAQLALARADVREQHGACALRLHGAWNAHNIGSLRECFSRAAETNKSITIDLGAVSYLDSAVVGLLVLLHGHQLAQGRELVLSAVPAGVRRVLKYCCAEYLYERAQPRAPQFDVDAIDVADGAESRAS